MKFIHLSDLHLGKRWKEYSLISDQEYILNEILNIIDATAPDGVIIAGDIYDKTVPSTDAVELFDNFIVSLANRKIGVYIISGNHDSCERVSFGGRIMQASNVYFAPVYDGVIQPIKLADKYGSLNLYMLPFIKPAHVRRFYPDDEIATYEDAIKLVINKMNVDKTQRNLLITHQFVTGAYRSDSEEKSVGGTDNIDVSLFEDFDYVALGHIHSPQNMGSKVRYCGTPLKYSFSEINQTKSVTLVEVNEKGNINIQLIPLKPLRDVVEIKGEFSQLTDKAFYQGKNFDKDYVRIILTDEEEVFNAHSLLSSIYHNLVEINYDNKRTKSLKSVESDGFTEEKSPITLCEEFYEKQNNQPILKEQSDYLKFLIEQIWEEK